MCYNCNPKLDTDVKGLFILNTSRFKYEGLKKIVVYICRLMGFMGTHTTHKHTTLYCIHVSIVIDFCALFVWYAGWLLSMSIMETGSSGKQSKSKGSSS